MRLLPHRLHGFGDSQNRVESVTMMKLGGAGNIADSTSPAQIDTKHSTLAITIALNGEPARILAVAAGVITSAKISKVPTAGTAMVITPAIIAINATFISPIGTPLACATCSSSELNSSGR